MSTPTIAPRTDNCAEKVPLRNQDAAIKIIAEHDRAACPKCRRGKVLSAYRCGRHWHCGHQALGY